MNAITTDQLAPGQITLQEVWRRLWRGRKYIALSAIVFAAGAAVAGYLLPKSYKASVTLSAVSNSTGGPMQGLGAMASQFGGLASLAGISIGGGGDSQKAESVAVLQSEALTEQYIRDNNLLPVLFRNQWDASAQRWKPTDPAKIPTLWRANVYFKNKIRTVTVEPKTGLIVLSIKFTDPILAAQWANDLVRLANEYLRVQAVTRAEKNVGFLKEEAAKTDVFEARQALYKLLEVEINKIMLARGNNEYAFKILDPAFAPERPSSPSVAVWLIAGFGLGLVLAGLVLLIWSAPLDQQA
jgi:uncharacterized protein involved in exopolysaccharide biosynthesis